jgi:hypothetical protein
MADKKRDPREALLMARGQARTACAVLSFNWSPLFNSWSISGDSHHQDPVISLMLTSSRIDSHRAQQYLDFSSFPLEESCNASLSIS